MTKTVGTVENAHRLPDGTIIVSPDGVAYTKNSQPGKYTSVSGRTYERNSPKYPWVRLNWRGETVGVDCFTADYGIDDILDATIVYEPKPPFVVGDVIDSEGDHDRIENGTCLCDPVGALWFKTGLGEYLSSIDNRSYFTPKFGWEIVYVP